MNKTQTVIATVLGLAASNGSLAYLPRFSVGGRTHRIYPHDEAKIAANNATAGERQNWNEAVEANKQIQASINRRAFVPRKAA